MTRAREGSADDDVLLAQRIVSGDAEAFSALVERYKRPIYHVCWRYLRGPDAEDVAQETFVRAFTGRERFDAARPLLPWLITIARRLCVDQLRRAKREHVSFVVESSAGEPEARGDPESDLAGRQEWARLDRAFGDLPRGQQDAILLFHGEGMPYRQIAESLEVPIGTVMTWLHRGRARLKEALASDGARGPVAPRIATEDALTAGPVTERGVTERRSCST